jgi:tetratricopeptide (TPR) repeat protein
MPDYRGTPASPTQSIKPIQVDPRKLRFSDLRRPYPTGAPEISELIVTNVGADRVTELTIGFLNTPGSACPLKQEDYDGLKRFSTNLLPGDSVTLRGDFGTRSQRFCLLKAWGPPEGRTACLSDTVSPDISIAACTRTIESGEAKGAPLATLYINRGSQWERKRDFDRAILDYDTAVELDPKNALAYRSRGIAYSKKGEHDLAITQFTEAIRFAPKDSRGYLFRGSEYERKGESDLAIADFNETIRLNPQERLGFMGRADMFYAKKQYSLAIRDCSEMIRLGPNDTNDTTSSISFSGRGSAYWDSGDYDRAFSDFNEAIRLNPRSATGYLGRGLGYEKKGEFEKALADFRAALAIDPNRSAALLGIWRVVIVRARDLGLKGQHDRVIADLTEVIPLNPNNQLAYLVRGFAYKNKGEHDRAIADFERFIQLGTDDRINSARAYVSRGEIYLTVKHDYDRGIADFTEAIRLDPKFGQSYEIRGRAYEEKREFERALADFRAALAINPNSKGAIDGIKRIEQSRGGKPGAL